MERIELLEGLKHSLDFVIPYENCCAELFQNAEQEVIRREYGRDGDTFLGYYCPSPIIDIVIGNLKRGRLVSKPKKKPDYIYGFDAQNRLRTIQHSFTNGIILYLATCEVCISFNVEHPEWWDFFSLVSYENKKKKAWTVYKTKSVGELQNRIYEIYCEEYFWKKNTFVADVSTYSSYSNPISSGMVQRVHNDYYSRDVYYFQQEDGWLKSFTVDKYCDKEYKNGALVPIAAKENDPAHWKMFSRPNPVLLPRNIRNPFWKICL